MMFEQSLPLVLTVVAIVAAWILLRFLLRITARVFSCGCLAILALGVLFLVVRHFAAI